jgi:hypothetical protein
MKRILSIIAAAALLPAAAHAESIFGLTSGGAIFSFDSSNPNTITGLTLVTGLGGNTLVDIDFYPVNGALYGFASSGNLYRINPFTGVATLDVSPSTSMGTVQHSDFNPAADRARILSAGNMNFRITPSVQSAGPSAMPGQVTADGSFAFASGSGTGTPNLVGAAYTNNFDGTSMTSLYTIDLNSLYLNSGTPQFNTLGLVGALGFTLSGINGFDISQSSGTAFLSDGDNLYTVNLSTGGTTLVGTIGGALGADTISIATVAVPEPSTYALAGIGLAGLLVAIRYRRVRA